MNGRPYLGIAPGKIPWAPKIDATRCGGCGQCMEVCSNGVFAPNEGAGKVEVVNPDNCVVLCDKCASFCPNEAISFPGKEETKELIQRLLRELSEQAGMERGQS